jgi:RNA polymerase sigma-70 factor (ECF subfamily)
MPPPACVLEQPLPDEQEDRRTSFEQEALVHLDALFRVALRLAGNALDADDLVQETLLKAYRAWDQYEKGTNARGWLLTILRSVFINEYRRSARRRAIVDLDAVEPMAALDGRHEADPEGAFFDNLVDDEVTRAVDALPLPYREVVVLHDVETLRYEEIATLLRIPVGTVKSRLFRARRLLYARLHKYAVSIGRVKGAAVAPRHPGVPA